MATVVRGGDDDGSKSGVAQSALTFSQHPSKSESKTRGRSGPSSARKFPGYWLLVKMWSLFQSERPCGTQISLSFLPVLDVSPLLSLCCSHSLFLPQGLCTFVIPQISTKFSPPWSLSGLYADVHNEAFGYQRL